MEPLLVALSQELNASFAPPDDSVVAVSTSSFVDGDFATALSSEENGDYEAAAASGAAAGSRGASPTAPAAGQEDLGRWSSSEGDALPHKAGAVPLGQAAWTSSLSSSYSGADEDVRGADAGDEDGAAAGGDLEASTLESVRALAAKAEAEAEVKRREAAAASWRDYALASGLRESHRHSGVGAGADDSLLQLPSARLEQNPDEAAAAAAAEREAADAAAKAAAAAEAERRMLSSWVDMGADDADDPAAAAHDGVLGAAAGAATAAGGAAGGAGAGVADGVDAGGNDVDLFTSLGTSALDLLDTDKPCRCQEAKRRREQRAGPAGAAGDGSSSSSTLGAAAAAGEPEREETLEGVAPFENGRSCNGCGVDLASMTWRVGEHGMTAAYMVAAAGTRLVLGRIALRAVLGAAGAAVGSVAGPAGTAAGAAAGQTLATVAGVVWAPDMVRRYYKDDHKMAQKRFGSSMPRHHCRACGQSYCRECLGDAKLALTPLCTVMHKVCPECQEDPEKTRETRLRAQAAAARARLEVVEPVQQFRSAPNSAKRSFEAAKLAQLAEMGARYQLALLRDVGPPLADSERGDDERLTLAELLVEQVRQAYAEEDALSALMMLRSMVSRNRAAAELVVDLALPVALQTALTTPKASDAVKVAAALIVQLLATSDLDMDAEDLPDEAYNEGSGGHGGSGAGSGGDSDLLDSMPRPPVFGDRDALSSATLDKIATHRVLGNLARPLADLRARPESSDELRAAATRALRHMVQQIILDEQDLMRAARLQRAQQLAAAAAAQGAASPDRALVAEAARGGLRSQLFSS